MKTWRQLEAMARRQGLRIYHDDREASLGDGPVAIVLISLWSGNRKTRDRILRAMVEAALEVGR